MQGVTGKERRLLWLHRGLCRTLPWTTVGGSNCRTLSQGPRHRGSRGPWTGAGSCCCCCRREEAPLHPSSGRAASGRSPTQPWRSWPLSACASRRAGWQPYLPVGPQRAPLGLDRLEQGGVLVGFVVLQGKRALSEGGFRVKRGAPCLAASPSVPAQHHSSLCPAWTERATHGAGGRPLHRVCAWGAAVTGFLGCASAPLVCLPVSPPKEPSSPGLPQSSCSEQTLELIRGLGSHRHPPPRAGSRCHSALCIRWESWQLSPIRLFLCGAGVEPGCLWSTSWRRKEPLGKGRLATVHQGRRPKARQGLKPCSWGA